ncbi:MAG: MFS transporter [Thaumarchaeota archaeon]|nr:MFS transporter [Nitrososphaerota archaeon]
MKRTFARWGRMGDEKDGLWRGEPAGAARESLWRHRDFLKLWSGETVSLLGDQFTGLAFPLTAILILHASPSQMGILQALSTLPFLLFGLVAGVWADRYRRRRLMILSDVSRALLLVSIPLAFISGSLSIYLLFFVSFTTGVFTVIFDVTYQAYLPSLVKREQLTDANGKLQASAATASVVGPTIAGGLIQVFAAPLAIFLDSLSFVWSAISLNWIRRKEENVSADTRRPMLVEIKDGLSLVLRESKLRSIAACTATANLFGGMINAVIILYAVNRLGMTPVLLGAMLALGSVGALLGALTAARIATHIRVGWLIILSAIIFSGGWLFVIPAVPPYGAYYLLAAFFIISFGSVVYNVNQISYRQALVPVKLQGRLNATMRFLVWGTLPIGAVIGGFLGQALGLYTALVAGTLGGSLSFLWVLFSPVRQVKTIPTAAEVGE